MSNSEEYKMFNPIVEIFLLNTSRGDRPEILFSLQQKVILHFI